jgi:hypothetical protein
MLLIGLRTAHSCCFEISTSMPSLPINAGCATPLVNLLVLFLSRENDIDEGNQEMITSSPTVSDDDAVYNQTALYKTPLYRNEPVIYYVYNVHYN